MNVEELNPISGQIIGAAIEVHRELGPGLLEVFWKETRIADELQRSGSPGWDQTPGSVGHLSSVSSVNSVFDPSRHDPAKHDSALIVGTFEKLRALRSSEHIGVQEHEWPFLGSSSS